MKMILIVAGMLLAALALPAGAHAKMTQEHIAEANAYYQQGEFRKAYKIYYDLAKAGDYFSQHQVSKMLARGEGTDSDLTLAYAWSVLAAEGGQREVERHRDELLQRIEDKETARDKAAELKKKYSQEAVQAKSQRRGRRGKSGMCTGSHLPC
jgi:predicted Zn-dependent protease